MVIVNEASLTESGAESIPGAWQPSLAAGRERTPEIPSDCRPPHEMSYLTEETLQYGVTPAQESETASSPFFPHNVHCYVDLSPS